MSFCSSKKTFQIICVFSVKVLRTALKLTPEQCDTHDHRSLRIEKVGSERKVGKKHVIVCANKLYSIVLHCIVLHCIVSYCIVLYCIILYCIVLYCIVLYCMVSYCIAKEKKHTKEILLVRVTLGSMGASYGVASNITQIVESM